MLALAVALESLALLAPTAAHAQIAPVGQAAQATSVQGDDQPRPIRLEHRAPVPAIPPGLELTKLNLHDFRVVERESGSFSYYKVVEDPVEPFLRAAYRPPLETVVIGIDVTDELRGSSRILRWKWRAMALPKDGDACRAGYGDSAAAVYVAWKRFLKIYSLKLVWSTVGKKGQTCAQTSNLFLAQQTVVLESGGPLGVWLSEELDLVAAYREHFANGDPRADVPDFLGVGVMSDGDQTSSVSEADYTNFVLIHDVKR